MSGVWRVGRRFRINSPRYAIGEGRTSPWLEAGVVYGIPTRGEPTALPYSVKPRAGSYRSTMSSTPLTLP